MGEGVNELYKSGDYVFCEHSKLIKKIERTGEGIYADAYLADWGYVWENRIRPATPEEIEGAHNQKVVVQILN